MSQYRILRRLVNQRHHAFSTIAPGRQAISSETFLRKAGYIALLGLAGYIVDREYYASTAVRNLRTFWTVRGVSRRTTPPSR
jgi:hypothetical protein